MRLLSVLFTEAQDEMPLSELAQHAGIAQATASREVARLAEHGIVVTHPLGRNTMVVANCSLPWARELRSMLVQTVGVLGPLAADLARVKGVEEAFVFGSWAERYEGEPGPPTRDIDVVVVGDAPLRAVRPACGEVERELRVEVNPVVVNRARWDAKRPESFIAQIRKQPMVRIPLERRR